jgi:hypothetical protein
MQACGSLLVSKQRLFDLLVPQRAIAAGMQLAERVVWSKYIHHYISYI